MKNPTVTLFSSVVLDTYQTISYNRPLLYEIHIVGYPS